jgi:hypothetical protein
VIIVPKIYVGSKKPNKTRFKVVFLGFLGGFFWILLGGFFWAGFFIANPALYCSINLLALPIKKLR